MREEKDAIGNKGSADTVCPTCGHSAPYHSLICPEVRGLYCVECDQRLPRHYTWCSRGQELGFFAWNVNCSQREVKEYFEPAG